MADITIHQQCRKEEDYLNAKINKMKVKVVSNMIMCDEITNFIYLEWIDEQLFKLEKELKIFDDEETGLDEVEETVDHWMLKNYLKRRDEVLKDTTREEIYKKAANAYFEACKFLFD